MLSARDRAAEVMEHLVTHASHGYSQPGRTGDGGTETVALSDGTTVEVATGDRDCSSAVCDAWEAAYPGSTGGASYTGNMRTCFTSTGLWTWHKGTSYSAKRGDVYLSEGHHTAMCIHPYGSPEGDILAEFSISETGGVDGEVGDQTGKESSEHAYYDYPWTGILEWTGPDDQEGSEVDTEGGFYPTIIDVSHHQGTIDWDTVKDYVHFAIVRVQDGATADRQLAANVAACERLGIPYYLYEYYRGGGASEAANMIGRANDAGAASLLGYVCDLEESGLGKDGVKQFFSTLPQGLKNGLYIAHNLYNEYGVGLGEDWVWIPRYGANTGQPEQMPSYSCDLWQFTSVGSVPGIDGNVDCNACVNKGLDYFIPSFEAPRQTVGGFADVYEDDWYAPYVVEAKSARWMTGYGDGTVFGPNDPLTRAQAVCVLARIAGADLSSPYADVSASPYYYEAVEWAKESGIASGDIDDFRPDDACTRAEAVTFLWRMQGEPKSEQASDYDDAPEWSKNAIAWAVSVGAVDEGSDLNPNGVCTRAVFASMLCRIY